MSDRARIMPDLCPDRVLMPVGMSFGRKPQPELFQPILIQVATGPKSASCPLKGGRMLSQAS